jgi:hypothetical protein
MTQVAELDAPPEVDAWLRRAAKLEWITIGYLVSAIAVTR